jgi:hypothetical protein
MYACLAQTRIQPLHPLLFASSCKMLIDTVIPTSPHVQTSIRIRLRDSAQSRSEDVEWQFVSTSRYGGHATKGLPPPVLVTLLQCAFYRLNIEITCKYHPIVTMNSRCTAQGFLPCTCRRTFLYTATSSPQTFPTQPIRNIETHPTDHDESGFARAQGMWRRPTTRDPDLRSSKLWAIM